MIILPHPSATQEHYHLHNHSSGLTIAYFPDKNAITYAGYIVRVGAKNDPQRYFGMAHLVEHMMFKGTSLRSSKQIIQRAEEVGADINAYTTKEETFVYAAFKEQYLHRMLHLLSDVVLHSRIPEEELEREKSVIIEEINSYKDTPAEQIFDEFEDILFRGSPLGHNILGTIPAVERISSSAARKFIRQYYRPENMILCLRGQVNIEQVLAFCDAYFPSSCDFPPTQEAHTLTHLVGEKPKVSRMAHRFDTYQSHCVLGGYAFSMHQEERLATTLLNNILGGPGMNSRLNMSLREERGYVYSVDSNYTPYSNSGIFTIYFGCAHKDREAAQRLVFEELDRLCNDPIGARELAAAQRQIMGQLAIAADNRETAFLSMGKSLLFYRKYDSLATIEERIKSVTASMLQDTACKLFAPENLLTLLYY